MFGHISSDILSLSNRIRNDVESSLDRIFNRWDLVEYDPIKYDPNTCTYHMKILTDDNGHVRVKTIRKDPGKDWDVHIEEFDRGKALTGSHHQALTHEGSQGQRMQQESQGQLSGQSRQTQSLGQGSLQQQQQQPRDLSKPGGGEMSKQDCDKEMQKIANSIKKDVESTLGQFFNTWELIDYDPLLFNPDHATYHLKIKTDDNGHVTVKTAKKSPGQPWTTRVKEFFKSGKARTLERGTQESSGLESGSRLESGHLKGMQERGMQEGGGQMGSMQERSTQSQSYQQQKATTGSQM